MLVTINEKSHRKYEISFLATDEVKGHAINKTETLTAFYTAIRSVQCIFIFQMKIYIQTGNWQIKYPTMKHRKLENNQTNAHF